MFRIRLRPTQHFDYFVVLSFSWVFAEMVRPELDSTSQRQLEVNPTSISQRYWALHRIWSHPHNGNSHQMENRSPKTQINKRTTHGTRLGAWCTILRTARNVQQLSSQQHNKYTAANDMKASGENNVGTFTFKHEHRKAATDESHIRTNTFNNILQIQSNTI